MIEVMRTVLIILGFGHIQLSLAQLIKTTCLRVPENGCFQAAFTTSDHGCDGWICWESQLTLSNKRFIIITLNQFRNSEARKNITNMNKLVWHWALEQEALRAATTCERKFLELYSERRNIPGLGYSLLCENGCMYREDMVLPSQTLFKQLFYSFLREGGVKHDYTFSNEESFQRGNVEFVGCSLVVMRSIHHGVYQNVFAFVCVLCTTATKWETSYLNGATDQCPPSRSLGGDKRYPKLCTSSELRNIFICEPENPCPDDPKTEVWQSEFEGLVSRLSFIQTNTGPLLVVNETTTQRSRLDDGTITDVTTTRTYVDTEGDFLKYFQVYPPMPQSIYFHPPQKAAIYDEILHSSIGPNVSFIYLENPGECVVVTPAPATMGTEDAFCCFYLMLATILTTIILGGLFAYTVNHHRKKTQ